MSGAEPPVADRWELIRDVLVFQLKLLIDAGRDVLMSPLSVAAGVAGLVLGGERPQSYFYAVLALGRRTERWINLFGARSQEGDEGSPGIDQYVARLEGVLIEQVDRGGMTAAAKDAVDRALDSVQRATGAPGTRRLPPVDSGPLDRSDRR